MARVINEINFTDGMSLLKHMADNAMDKKHTGPHITEEDCTKPRTLMKLFRAAFKNINFLLNSLDDLQEGARQYEARQKEKSLSVDGNIDELRKKVDSFELRF